MTGPAPAPRVPAPEPRTRSRPLTGFTVGRTWQRRWRRLSSRTTPHCAHLSLIPTPDRSGRSRLGLDRKTADKSARAASIEELLVKATSKAKSARSST